VFCVKGQLHGKSTPQQYNSRIALIVEGGRDQFAFSFAIYSVLPAPSLCISVYNPVIL
jgi:hypothetical protein